MRKLAIFFGAVFLMVAISTGGFGVERPVLVCKLSDPNGYVPAGFEDSLCAQLSEKLNLRISNDGSGAAQSVIVLSIATLSNQKAQFELYAGADHSADNPTHGPFIVETMDADLATALPDHLRNELKRLLGL